MRYHRSSIPSWLPPTPRRWSHNWRATIALQRAGGRADWHPTSHLGCHRPRVGGATTGVLPSPYNAPAVAPIGTQHTGTFSRPQPARGGSTEHSAAGRGLMWPRNTAGVMVSVTLGHVVRVAIAPRVTLDGKAVGLPWAGIGGPFRARWRTNVRPCGRRSRNRCDTIGVPSHLGCHRPRVGGATTGVLPSPYNAPAVAPIGTQHTGTFSRPQPVRGGSTEHSAAGRGLMWPRNTAGVMVSVTLGHVVRVAIAPRVALDGKAVGLPWAGIGGPFRARWRTNVRPCGRQSRNRCDTIGVPSHLGCHRPRVGGATTGVLPSPYNARRSRRLAPNTPAHFRDRNPARRVDRALGGRPRVDVASKYRRRDGERNARPCGTGRHRTQGTLDGKAVGLPWAGIGGPFRARWRTNVRPCGRQSRNRCDTIGVPSHLGCHRPRVGGATTGVLPSPYNARRSRRLAPNTPAHFRDRNPCAAGRPSTRRQAAG